MIGSVDDLDLASPDLLGRCSWQVGEARQDVEVLAWIARFRFVTPAAIADRFEVSWQRANARVRRLQRLGLVACGRDHVSQPRAVFLTGRGYELLGQPRRRPPRAQVQREHEAAIVWVVTRLEREAAVEVRALTERECRRLEAAGEERRYSVELDDRARRWADVVVELGIGGARSRSSSRRREPRLAQLVAAWQCSEYDEVVFSSGAPRSGAASGASSP